MIAPFTTELINIKRDEYEVLEQESIKINQKINLFSKATENHFKDRHINHSLSLLKNPFPANAIIADWGTGGGFPGLPLAIACSDVHFYLIDAVAKKIQAVRSVARRVGLSNVTALHQRAETFSKPIHYSVSRATAPLSTLWKWHIAVVEPFSAPIPESCWPQGLYCLKGGNLEEEIADLHRYAPNVVVGQLDLHVLLGDSYFDKKYIVSVTQKS